MSCVKSYCINDCLSKSNLHIVNPLSYAFGQSFFETHIFVPYEPSCRICTTHRVPEGPFLVPSRESRSSGAIARILNNKVRILSLSIENNRSIRSCDGGTQDHRPILLPKDNTEEKILSSGKRRSGAGTVTWRTAAYSLGIIVAQAITPDCIGTKVQESNVVNLYTVNPESQGLKATIPS